MTTASSDPEAFGKWSSNATLSPCPEEETATSSSEDDDRMQLALCQAQLRAAQARLAQIHQEMEVQKRLHDASLRAAQKRLSAAMVCKRPARTAPAAPLVSLPSVCADALDALERLSAHVAPAAGTKIQGDFRKNCLLVLHPDKSAKDERNVACLQALQEEWEKRRKTSR